MIVLYEVMAITNKFQRKACHQWMQSESSNSNRNNGMQIIAWCVY
jgi:hypothetical protein